MAEWKYRPMRRRVVLSGVAAARAGRAAAPARAQTNDRILRLGWLRPNAPGSGDIQNTGIPAALQRLGWTQGRNLQIEVRWADGRPERMRTLAAELAQARCDAVLTVGASGTIAMVEATKTIPVVMFGNFDPVARGLVTNLARPGGNLTGVLIAPDGSLANKRLEVLRDAAPHARRIALLAPVDPSFDIQIAETRAAASALDLELHIVTARGGDYRRAFADIAAAGARAVLVGAHTFFMSDRRALIDLALKGRLPTSWEWAEQVRDGGLLAYGTSLVTLYDRVASQLDRIFRGARAGDLPVERPSTFGLTLNLKTARAIGLELPKPLLLRADELIR
jgi:putative ABC transport system substrate-binding protein